MINIKLHIEQDYFLKLIRSSENQVHGLFDFAIDDVRKSHGVVIDDIELEFDDDLGDDAVKISWGNHSMNFETLSDRKWGQPHTKEWSDMHYLIVPLTVFIKKTASKFIDEGYVERATATLEKSHYEVAKVAQEILDKKNIGFVLKALVRDGIPINNLALILSSMMQHQIANAPRPTDMVVSTRAYRYISEPMDNDEKMLMHVRQKLANEITFSASNFQWKFQSIQLDEWGEQIDMNKKLTEKQREQFFEKTDALMATKDTDWPLAFLCSGPRRSILRSVTKDKYQDIPVLAYEELYPSTQIKSLGKVGFLNMLLLILISLFSMSTISAQSALFDLSENEFNSYLNYAQLVQNDHEMLPFAKLDETDFQYIAFSETGSKELPAFLSRYAPIKKLNNLPSHQIDKKRQVLILFFEDAASVRFHKAAIDTMINHYETVSIISDLDTYEAVPNIVSSDAIIHLFNADAPALDILSQQLFGAATLSSAQLKDQDGQSLNEEISQLTDLSRLGYGPPSNVGMNGDEMASGIDEIALEGLDSMAYPGCQILVARHGKIVFHRTYGHHTYEDLLEVQQDDVYDLASITKISSATMALMKLNGENKFDLDAPLKKYFPRFENTNKADLKWRQILAHNARLKSWIAYHTFTKKENGKYFPRTLKNKYKRKYPIRLTDQLYLHRDYREKEIYRMIAESPLNPEAGYVYSGLSFYLYPEIVEGIANMPFEQYLKKEIYQPLGAFDITYNPLRYYSLDRIVPTERDTFFRMTQLHGVVHDEGAAMMQGVSANAGLFSTATDLAKLMQMVLNGGRYGDAEILKPEVIKEFTRCQYCDEGNRRGLGFERPLIEYDENKSHVAKEVSQSSFGHSGYTGTFVWTDPEDDLIFIFLSNRVFPTRLNRKLYTMNIRPRIQKVIYDSMVD